MNAREYERKQSDWKNQAWKPGSILHVGMADSYTHEGLLNGVIVGHIIMIGHCRDHRRRTVTL